MAEIYVCSELSTLFFRLILTPSCALLTWGRIKRSTVDLEFKAGDRARLVRADASLNGACFLILPPPGQTGLLSA